ncbi:MAG: cobalamin B12-binding domain-containing protein [Candidatus Aminicenantes bacterium]|nr:cobalamin B12-binding domain-containing protein [Candidatus Aminicenantes bacterium]
MDPARKVEKKIRVLLAKPGLDGHDRGIKVVARALKNAGMEVIYMGLRVTPDQVVAAAIQEDVDVIGISNLSAAHVPINREIMRILKKRNAANIPVIAGGTILEEDRTQLERMGVAACFTPGTDTNDIVKFIREKVNPEKIL